MRRESVGGGLVNEGGRKGMVRVKGSKRRLKSGLFCGDSVMP